MSLPNPSMSFTPFDPLTAAEMNDIVENVEALADGTGIANAAITPAKRTGGFKVGTFTSSGTSNIVVTGVGFQPKGIMCWWLGGDDTLISRIGIGAADGTSQNATAARGANSGTNMSTQTETDALILATTTNGGILVEGALSSFDADGFTITVSTGTANNTFGYLAFG